MLRIVLPFSYPFDFLCRDEILEAVPEKEGPFIKVPKIL
jgi:Asp-tRNA(Asn)/Glu-tRNA(Gln) amidotransferase C subunit